MTATPNLKKDFAIFTYHVKGLVLSSLLMEERLFPLIKNEWKMNYKRLVTAAKNYEADMNKMLSKENVEVVEDLDATIFDVVSKLMSLEGEEFKSYVEHLNNWEKK